ncbi:DMT family transporter [Usitatibacter palustris]|uniref:DMT family transporter n=1 Tax=Usitatibacter palustris TaxID=2732487 RepID=UPI0014895AC0|nr:DMT family transporter [Usitatibacter palustris]
MSNLQLFAACVAIWSTTWLAITYQLGVVAPEASVAYRFGLASLMLFGWCWMRGLSLRFSGRVHAWIALQGVLMFSASYIFVYYAEEHVVSGLVAVGFSATPLISMLGMRVAFGTPITQRMTIGSILGIVGITLVYWPEFGKFQGDRNSALGVIFTVVAVTLSMLGSLVANRNQNEKINIWPTMAWGMLYGTACSIAWTLVAGKEFAFVTTPAYVLSLLYLAVFGTILAFGSYLTLLGRIGAARSGFIGVMVPVLALVISSVFEGFHWQLLTFAGVLVCIAGNAIILRRFEAPRPAAKTA